MPFVFISISLTFLSYITWFLLVTIFIFPPLGFFFGLKAYRQKLRVGLPLTYWGYLSAAFPMIFAAATFIFQVYVTSTEYRP